MPIRFTSRSITDSVRGLKVPELKVKVTALLLK